MIQKKTNKKKNAELSNLSCSYDFYINIIMRQEVINTRFGKSIDDIMYFLFSAGLESKNRIPFRRSFSRS